MWTSVVHGSIIHSSHDVGTTSTSNDGGIPKGKVEDAPFLKRHRPCGGGKETGEGCQYGGDDPTLTTARNCGGVIFNRDGRQSQGRVTCVAQPASRWLCTCVLRFFVKHPTSPRQSSDNTSVQSVLRWLRDGGILMATLNGYSFIKYPLTSLYM